MPDDDSYTQFVTVRATPPPLTSGATLHWDGMSALSRRGALTMAVKLRGQIKKKGRRAG